MKDRINSALDLVVNNLYPISRDYALPGSFALLGLIMLGEGKFNTALTVEASAVVIWGILRGLDFMLKNGQNRLPENLRIDTRPLFVLQTIAYTGMASIILFGSALEVVSLLPK